MLSNCFVHMMLPCGINKHMFESQTKNDFGKERENKDANVKFHCFMLTLVVKTQSFFEQETKELS